MGCRRVHPDESAALGDEFPDTPGNRRIAPKISAAPRALFAPPVHNHTHIPGNAGLSNILKIDEHDVRSESAEELRHMALGPVVIVHPGTRLAPGVEHRHFFGDHIRSGLLRSVQHRAEFISEMRHVIEKIRIFHREI